MTTNTLKSLTNAHTIRGIATLKDVERFSKGHFERYREFIVKLIVNYLSNKLPILSKANYILTNYTGSTTTNDSTYESECQQSSIEEKVKIVSILSEEDKRRATCVHSRPRACDSVFTNTITSFIILLLSTLLLLSVLIQGSIFSITYLIILILTILGYKTVKFFDYYTQTENCCHFIV